LSKDIYTYLPNYASVNIEFTPHTTHTIAPLVPEIRNYYNYLGNRSSDV
jgi:hypothetical protein